MSCVPDSELPVSWSWQSGFLAVLPTVRTLARQNSSDLHGPLAKRKHEIHVRSLTSTDQPWDRMLTESRRVLPADRAAFRLDLDQWVSGMTLRDRQIIAMLASGEATSAVAGRFGLTAGRVSQLRRRYVQDWLTFQGEALGSN